MASCGCISAATNRGPRKKPRKNLRSWRSNLITVKGKTEPEAIHTVLGREEVAGDIRFQELRKVYSAMLHSYRSRDWEGAMEALRVCRSFDPEFGLEALFDLYQARIQAFSEVAPSSDWKGVFVAETK